MKILQLVTKRQYRGAEVLAANLSKELIKVVNEIIILGLYKNDENVLTVDNAENYDLIESKNGSFSLRLIKRLVKLIKITKPEIIQCNGSDTLKYMVAASFFISKKPIVYRNISMISEWVSHGSKKWLYKQIFKKVDHVTSVGEEAIQDFIKTLNYPEKLTTVIRRGIPIKEVNNILESQKLRTELNLKKETKIAIHIGNFSAEKNHGFLLDIFEDLKSIHPYLKLICVGNGILFDHIKNEISERKLEETVFLLGFRKDIPELLSASDCFVLSSKVEGVPGVVLEAGTQKIPTISTNVGGVSEVLINGQTGFLIEEFNKDEFKEKLIELMYNSKLRKDFGENAYNMISKGFDSEITAKKFESLYQNLIETNNK